MHNKHKTITRVSPAHRRTSIMTTGFGELPHIVPDQIQTRSNVYFLLDNITLIRNKTYLQLSTPTIPFQLLSFCVFLCCLGLFPRAAVRACPVFWRRINMAQLNDCAELKVSAELNAWLTLEMTQRCLSGDQLWFHTHTYTYTRFCGERSSSGVCEEWNSRQAKC